MAKCLRVSYYFPLRYVVDKKEDPSFEGSEGYITEWVLRRHVPPPSDDSLILVCGPPPMMKAISGDKAKDNSQGAPSPWRKRYGKGRPDASLSGLER